MTLAAEVVRLAAIECLSPTAAHLDGSGFPTLAGGRVYDSRQVPLGDVDRDRPYTPTLAIYTRQSGSARRGDGQGSVDRFATCTLEIIAELTIAASGEGQSEYADALADDDPQARIVLAALCTQVRRLLTVSAGGMMFRRNVAAIERITEEPFAVPQLGLRWQRTTMLFECLIADDEFDIESGGLPEPASSFRATLHDNSYAAGVLDTMAAHFAGEALPPRVESIAFEAKRLGISGQAGPAASVAPPFEEIEEP